MRLKSTAALMIPADRTMPAWPDAGEISGSTGSAVGGSFVAMRLAYHAVNKPPKIVTAQLHGFVAAQFLAASPKAVE